MHVSALSVSTRTLGMQIMYLMTNAMFNESTEVPNARQCRKNTHISQMVRADNNIDIDP